MNKLLKLVSIFDKQSIKHLVRMNCVGWEGGGGDGNLFSEANKTLSSYLKQLVSAEKIAGTGHKNATTAETIKKLYEKGELADVVKQNPRVFLQTP